MNIKAFLLLCALSATAHAAEPAAQQPPANEPQAAQPKPDANEEPAPGEPQVTISTQGEQTISEYRAGGMLYMIKITPKHGHPYYLIDDRGDGRFARRDGLDSGVRVPQWVIKKF